MSDNNRPFTSLATGDWHPEYLTTELRRLFKKAGIPFSCNARGTPDDYVPFPHGHRLYHATPADNLSHISGRGLSPRASSQERGQGNIADFNAVFAADCLPILSAVDRDFHYQTDWVVLRFPAGDRDWGVDPEFAWPEDAGSYLTADSIDAGEIEVLLDDGTWARFGKNRQG